MQKPSVYLETTIISYLTAWPSRDLIRAAEQQATREWWNVSRAHFEIYTSEVVLDEASRGDPQAAAARLAVLQSIALAPVPPSAVELAELLLARGVLPSKARLDALHVAVSANSAIRYLLTWNCKHLANATLRVKIEETCRDQGYEPPIICTPFELQEVRS